MMSNETLYCQDVTCQKSQENMHPVKSSVQISNLGYYSLPPPSPWLLGLAWTWVGKGWAWVVQIFFDKQQMRLSTHAIWNLDYIWIFY